jgi:hypothetical protein
MVIDNNSINEKSLYSIHINKFHKIKLDEMYFGTELSVPPLIWCNKHDVTTSNNIKRENTPYLTQKLVSSLDFHKQYVKNYLQKFNLTYDESLFIHYLKLEQDDITKNTL